MAAPKAIEVDGLRELNRALRRSADTDLPKRLGQANKAIGQLVIDRVQPRPQPEAVGQGAGSSIRPSASKREVLLRVGGKHRESDNEQTTKVRQWGKKVVPIRGRAPKRPYIKQTLEDHYDEITAAYLEAIADAMRPAVWKAE